MEWTDDTRLENPNRVKPDLAATLDSYGFDLPVYRTGNGLKVRCVFHGDTHASAVFNEERQFYKCFACDASGDSWQIIMDQEGLEFPDAMKYAVEVGLVELADDNITLIGGVRSQQQEAPPRRSRRRRGGRIRRRRR